MKKSEFFYDLPQELIAQVPLQQRDHSRLLVYNRSNGEIQHKKFYEIDEFLKEGDLLVANNSRVMPARLFAFKGERKIEILLCKRQSLSAFLALAKPSKHAKIGDLFRINEELAFKVISKGEFGEIGLEFIHEGALEEKLDKAGQAPLPHYIKERLEDSERYQTIYSKQKGSAAAPTAGLHFTAELIQKLRDKGVEWAEVCLHVGLGTFRPLKCENLDEHRMHSEWFSMEKEVCESINRAKREGRRIISVGTTTTRVLESLVDESGFVRECTGETNIFIYPPYKFKVVDALITNFHLPESTLIMLVSAFLGRENALKIYAEAVKERYRFFSFGDACFFI